ncbi:aldolase [Halobacillus litoralis]|uniref:aldolase n=1 Tax=Halobacillus litoralis TaxID=45668 RepID=UPI001CFE9B3E|nr:aldolase [Halobacillus litoralis]WLR49149.1 aldolase [Halobacillus litoralis]
MRKTLKKGYHVFGLHVSSEMSLPEVPQANLSNTYADVTIRQINLEDQWEKVSGNGKSFYIEENLCMFKVTEVCVCLIRNGNEILFTPLPGSVRSHVRLYILGSCMGIILMQRKILPLHGSAISIDGNAYAIVGDSGAGKSTLASAFLKRGYKLLSDDVIPVSFSDERVPMVTPAYPQQKLWQESMDHFGFESGEYEPIIDRETKFKVPVGDQFEERQLPLAGIIELTKTDDEQVHIEPIQDLYRFSTLFKHTYRNFIIRRAGLMDWHFNTSTKILPHVDMFHMRRPVSQFTANELVDKVLQAIGKEESVV